jgi:hypothetical protein
VQIAAENDHGIWWWREKIGHEILKALLPGVPGMEVGVPGFPNPVIAYELVFPRPGQPKKTKPNPTVPGGKGDLDNHQKCFMDVGNDLGIWHDDRHVWLVAGCMKRVASGDVRDPPRADVTIWDASEFRAETWMEWILEHWPTEWDDRTAITKG